MDILIAMFAKRHDTQNVDDLEFVKLSLNDDEKGADDVENQMSKLLTGLQDFKIV